MQRRYLAGLMVLVALALGLPLVAQAVPVGRFVQVEGSVDLMKGGKFPAVPVKVQDEVEQGDAVRTKSLSKAQIRFVDDTVLAIASESRVAIDEYVYDAAKSKRQATVEIFRGMVHFVVSKILQTEKPDFIMKTHTGVLGVRGTGWYAQLTALDTDIYNEHGTTEVQNLFPEVPGKVTLTGMQFTRVGINLPPTLPMPFTQEDLQQLRIQFRSYGGGSGAASPLETGALGSGFGPGTFLGTYFLQNNQVNNPINNPAITLFTQNPLLNNPANNPLIFGSTPSPAPGPGPSFSTYGFTMDLYGYRTDTPTSLYNANVISANWGELTLTSDAPEYFTTSGSGTRSSTSPIFTGTSNYTATDVLNGTVTGVSGQALTGTYSATFSNSKNTSGIFSGPITINPDGTFNFSYTNLSGSGTNSNGTYTVTGTGSSSGTPGTYFSQTAVGSVAQAGNASGNQQTVTNLNSYPIWGTRTGVYPGTFAATLNMNNTAPVTGYYPPADQGSLAATMQGVVSGPAGGAQTGVMTTIAGGQEEGSQSFTFAGPVTINPNGNLSANFYGTNTDNSVMPAPAGIFKQSGTWSQTAQAIPSASTYSFSIPVTENDLINPTSTSQASVQSQGFGTRTGVFPGTYLGNVDNGTLTGGSNSFSLGNGSSTGVSGTLSGTVTGVLGGYTLTGTGSFSGTSNTGQAINYTGPITIAPNGALTFNYTGTVSQGDSPTLNAAGTMTQNFALAISQSASGTYQAVSGGSTPTLLNTSQMTGSQTVSGLGSTATNGSLALGYGNGSGLPPVASGGSGTFSVSGAGAVSPWYGGQATYGMLSSTVTVGEASVPQTPMQVTYYPTTRNLTGQVAIGGAYSNSYINAILATTPTSSGQTTTSFYQTFSPGTYQLTSSSPYSTGVYTNTSPLTGTMLLGGSGAIVSAPITANFNLTGTGAAGAFPPSDGGTVTVNNFLGAVAGPATGTQTGLAMGSATFNSSQYSSSSMGFGGVFTLGPNIPPSPLQASLTIGQGNTGTGPYGYPMSVTGSWTQSDPPASATQTAAATAAATSWGPNSRPLGWAIQNAAAIASQGGTPSAATAGAGANTPLLSARLTRLTGISLGSRIQGAAQLTQPGTPGNPALAANLQAAWRFRQQQRLAALRTASGATPGGQTSGNPAGPILALQRH
ncbi:MAG: FecR domain-containing protein [Desulfobaccales bacterium]